MLNIQSLIDDIRAGMNQYTAAGQRVAGSADLAELASDNFSPADYAERILDAACDIIALSRPQHVRALWETFNPTENLENHPNYTVVLGSKTQVNGAKAYRRGLMEHIKKSDPAQSMPSSPDAPVWVFEDMEWIVATDEEASSATTDVLSGAEATAVIEPRIEDDEENPLTDTSVFDAGTDPEDYYVTVPAIFRQPLVLHVLSNCFSTLAGAGGELHELYQANAQSSAEDYERYLSRYRQPRSLGDDENN